MPISFTQRGKPVKRRPADPDLLTREEAAAHIGVSPGSLAHWSAGDRGPTMRVIGRRSYYTVADLDEWVANARPRRKL
jgi:hypothetical protein